MITEETTYEKILVQDEILIRQIHPTKVQNDRVSTSIFAVSDSVFKPTDRDAGHLSCSQRKMITEQESHRVFTSIKKRSSCGVAKVTIGEIVAENLGAFASPSTEGPSPDADVFDGAHAHIDFTAYQSKSDIKTKAKQLTKKATERGFSWFDTNSNLVDNPTV